MSTDTATKTVLLVDGPLAGQRVTVPKAAETYRLGPLPKPFFVYQFAGRLGTDEVFARQPQSRIARRIIWSLIGKTGRDPRVNNAMYKLSPITGSVNKAGRGAAKRRARHGTTEAA